MNVSFDKVTNIFMTTLVSNIFVKISKTLKEDDVNGRTLDLLLNQITLVFIFILFSSR